MYTFWTRMHMGISTKQQKQNCGTRGCQHQNEMSLHVCMTCIMNINDIAAALIRFFCKDDTFWDADILTSVINVHNMHHVMSMASSCHSYVNILK